MNDNTWRKSSRSEAQNACVELAVGTTRTGIRDTKNRDGGTLTVGATPFSAFLASIKAGELDGQG
jgi:hypothetical protein